MVRILNYILVYSLDYIILYYIVVYTLFDMFINVLLNRFQTKQQHIVRIPNNWIPNQNKEKST